MKSAETFASVYYMIVSTTLAGAEKVEEMNVRTGQRIRALPGGASFRVDLSDGMLPMPGSRRVKPHIAAAEAAWCLRGDNHIDWLRNYTKVWDNFADVQPCVICDGSGRVASDESDELNAPCRVCRGDGKAYWLQEAYGNRWTNTFGYDQIAVALERLKTDSSDRRVWISSWDPSEDLLPNGQKTVPCPVGFTLSVMAKKLHTTLMIRSSDLYMGLPYDVMRHALLTRVFAASLGVDPGIMRVVLAHPHIYESQWSLADQMLACRMKVPDVAMPEWSVSMVRADPASYVELVRGAVAAVPADKWPTFEGKSEVVR